MTCEHIKEAKKIESKTDGCEECLKSGDKWVHLRSCVECGHVGCCDSSENKHATAHFEKTKHPVITSAEPGEHWLYCFIDKVTSD